MEFLVLSEGSRFYYFGKGGFAASVEYSIYSISVIDEIELLLHKRMIRPRTYSTEGRDG
jgi:hypothetical protein